MVPAEEAFDFCIPRLAGGKGLPSWAEKHGDSCSFWTFLSFKGGQGDLPGQGNKRLWDFGIWTETKHCSKLCNSWVTSPSQCPTWKTFSQVLSWKSPKDSSSWQLETWDVTATTKLWKVETSPVLQFFCEVSLLHPICYSHKHSCIHWVYQHLPVRRNTCRRVWST